MVSKKWSWWVVGLVGSLGLGLIIFGLFSLKWLLSPMSESPETVVVVIRKGQTVDQIAQTLVEKRLIRNQLSFKVAVWRLGLGKKLQAGTFKLAPNMSVNEIAEHLTKGTLDVWVTIVEGLRLEEVADILEEAFLGAGANLDKKAFIAAAQGKEGYLFPDTYLMPLGTSTESMVTLFTTTFEKKVIKRLQGEIDGSKWSLNQIITMASLVEREARTDDARRMVAGILWKRVESGWPLQVDATLQYAIGYDKVQKTWWRPPLGQDKEVQSAYNTYLNVGLPPGPICSPSFSSIQAVLTPIPSDYWFYITDTKGMMHYAVTVEQHINNVNTYLK